MRNPWVAYSLGMDVLRRAYDAFNARDIEGALALMHEDVEWANGMDGGYEHGHAAVRAYWTRQWGLIDPHVDPLGFTAQDDGRVAVDVHAVVRDLEGATISDGRVIHVYTLRDGLVARMDIVSPA